VNVSLPQLGNKLGINLGCRQAVSNERPEVVKLLVVGDKLHVASLIVMREHVALLFLRRRHRPITTSASAFHLDSATQLDLSGLTPPSEPIVNLLNSMGAEVALDAHLLGAELLDDFLCVGYQNADLLGREPEREVAGPAGAGIQ
jgi:hypothetical protein